MITIHNKLFSTYDNDIRALVNAFYPGVPLQFSANEDGGAVGVSESRDRTAHEKVFETRASDSQEIQILDLDSLAPQIERAENRFEEKTNLKLLLYR